MSFQTEIQSLLLEAERVSFRRLLVQRNITTSLAVMACGEQYAKSHSLAERKTVPLYACVLNNSVIHCRSREVP